VFQSCLAVASTDQQNFAGFFAANMPEITSSNDRLMPNSSLLAVARQGMNIPFLFLVEEV